MDDELPGYDPDYCPPVETWDSGWASFEDDVVRLVNERRSEGGVCGGQSFGASAGLSKDSALRCAARNHSKDMATRGFFDHQNPDGENPEDRITRAGFDWTAIGENIAMGQPTPDEVMADWMSSPGHCSNILSPAFDYIGVGYYGTGNYWTQAFGAH
jgi:uncharacterized protein YkwD